MSFSRLAFLFALILLVSGFLVLGCSSGDDDDDRNDDDDDDDDAPATYIVTSGYGDEYYVFDGEDYSLVGAYNPLGEWMAWIRHATLIPSLMGPMAIFSAKPEDSGHAELFYADALSDNAPVQLTSLGAEGLADTSPDYNGGVVFVGVKTLPSHPEVLTITPGATEPEVYKSGTFSKVIGGDLCETTVWARPRFSPGGEYFASGWMCKDNEGPEIPAYTTILSFNSDEEECGDPLFEREGHLGVQDVCFTNDSSMVLFSIGVGNVTLEVFAAKTDGSEDAVDVTDAFNGGDIIHFDCDPTSPKVVFNDLAVNPNLFVMEYEVSDGDIAFDDPTQITEDSRYRNPRWIHNPE
jgi:hypothetical protein